jgi:hypothetical protein
MKPPNAKHLLKYFNTAVTDPVTLAPHLGWLDKTPPTGSPEDLGYGAPVAPPVPYYFGPWSPGSEAEARIAETFGDQISDVRMGYFSVRVTPGKEGNTGVGGTRVTRTKSGEKYRAVRVLDHLESGGLTRVLFMKE